MTPSLERLGRACPAGGGAEPGEEAGCGGRAGGRAASARPSAGAGDAGDRLREVRPARLRELEQADADEQQLKELVKKLAQFKAVARPRRRRRGPDRRRPGRDRPHSAARPSAALEEVTREADEARKVLRVAMEHYQQIRRELDRLQPQLAEKFSSDDRLLWDAETLFPGGQLQALAREVEAGTPYFGVARPRRAIRPAQDLDRPLSPVPGRRRRGRGRALGGDQSLSLRVFHQLKTLSKQHEPGLHRGVPAGLPHRLGRLHRRRPGAVRPGHRAPPGSPATASSSAASSRPATSSASRSLARRAASRSPSSRPSWPASTSPTRASRSSSNLLKQAVNGLGASDPELLELVMPFREHVSGGNGLRALRRNLDRLRQEEIEATTPTRFGPVRRPPRRHPGRACPDDRRLRPRGRPPHPPAPLRLRPPRLGALRRRQARRPRLPGTARPQPTASTSSCSSAASSATTSPTASAPSASRTTSPACMVEHGYGPAQIGETLRRGLIKQ